MAVSLESGDLASTPLAALLLEALDRHATGALAVDDAGAHSRVFVVGGLPAGAQSYASFRPLGQILMQQGRIDMDALSRSLSEMARSGRPQGEILAELGAVSRDDVARALAEQQATYVHDIAARGSGAYTWRDGLPPEWTRGIRIPPLRALVAALQAPASAPVVAEVLARLGSAEPIALSPAYAGVAHAFAWTADEAALVERLRTGASLAAIAEGTPDPARARAVVAALVRLGLAGVRGAAVDVPAAVAELAADERPAAPARAAAPPAAPGGDARQEAGRAVPPHRALPQEPAAAPPGATNRFPKAAALAELRSALESALPRARDPDLFARLGVPRSATRDQVKHAYLALAKRFHPDRYLAPELADLQPKVQELFAALNEAYDVLGDDRRRTHHLATLGAAWASDDAAARVDYEKGEACLRTRDYRRARGFFEAAGRADPRPEYLASAAYAIVLEGPGVDREHARDLARRAIADPRCDRAAYVMGVLAREDGDAAAAERYFRAALHANPRHADAARELRALDMRRGGNTRK